MLIDDENMFRHDVPERYPRERRRSLFINIDGQLRVNPALDFLPAAGLIMGAIKADSEKKDKDLTQEEVMRTLNGIHRDFEIQDKEIEPFWAGVVANFYGVSYNDENRQFELIPQAPSTDSL